MTYEPEPLGELDPQTRVAHALDLAYRHLAKRDRTEVEVRRHLVGRGVEEATVTQVLRTLEEQGYVDDRRYAHRFAEDRRTLDGWGAERIEQRLLALGVAPEVVAEAVASQPPEAELDAAVSLLRRRFREPPADDRGRNRALGLLVRRGYDLELAHDAIRALARG